MNKLLQRPENKLENNIKIYLKIIEKWEEIDCNDFTLGTKEWQVSVYL